MLARFNRQASRRVQYTTFAVDYNFYRTLGKDRKMVKFMGVLNKNVASRNARFLCIDAAAKMMRNHQTTTHREPLETVTVMPLATLTTPADMPE